ncbi:MAG: CHAD domain-containing protein [Candidatus Eremiobacteraeota bacterium]|nr:CHAD domain-containing protein [Candidatus Eremiobacteraeota bacterium]
MPPRRANDRPPAPLAARGRLRRRKASGAVAKGQTCGRRHRRGARCGRSLRIARCVGRERRTRERAAAVRRAREAARRRDSGGAARITQDAVRMKPQRVDLQGAKRVHDIVERIVSCRLSEARSLAKHLQKRDPHGLHAFRIACKRLRYALERFESLDPSLEKAAIRLAQVQDELGETHDRDVLLAILPPELGETHRRLVAERSECVMRAKRLWRRIPELLESRRP